MTTDQQILAREVQKLATFLHHETRNKGESVIDMAIADLKRLNSEVNGLVMMVNNVREYIQSALRDF